MKISRFIYLFIIIACLLFVSCSGKNSDNERQTKEVTYDVGYASTELNVRAGPGKKYDVIGKLYPQEAVYILEYTSDKWARVINSNGNEGYVATAYLANISPVVLYLEEGQQPYMCADDNPDYYESDEFIIHETLMDRIVQKCAQSIIRIIDMGNSAWLFITAFFALDILIIWGCHKKYNYLYFLASKSRPSIWPGYLAVIFSLILELGVIIGVFTIRDGASSFDAIYGGLIVASGAVAVSVPWRISLSGKNIYSDKNEPNRTLLGRIIGFVNWLIMLVPLSIFMFGVHSYVSLQYVNNDFGYVLLFSVIFFAGSFIVLWLWKVFVMYCLESIPNILLFLFYIVIVLSLSFIGFHTMWVNFKFLKCLFGLAVVFYASLFFLITTITHLSRYRCPDCHKIAGEERGVTDHGTRYTTRTRWLSESSDNIPSNSGNIFDAYSQVRTTYAEHTWTEHQGCPFCEEEWDVNFSSGERAVGHETLRKEWKEWRD